MFPPHTKGADRGAGHALLQSGVYSLRFHDVLPELTRPVHEIVEQLPYQVL